MNENAFPILHNDIVYYSTEIVNTFDLKNIDLDFSIDKIKKNKCIQNSCLCAENIEECLCVEGILLARLGNEFQAFCHCWNKKGDNSFDITKERILDMEEPDTIYVYFPFSEHKYTEYPTKYGNNLEDYGYINDGIYEFQKTIHEFILSRIKKENT